jgi:hypothetical protein
MTPADAMAGLHIARARGMSFRQDNAAYDAWLATQCDVVKKDVKYKHHRMKRSAFIFLRSGRAAG